MEKHESLLREVIARSTGGVPTESVKLETYGDISTDHWGSATWIKVTIPGDDPFYLRLTVEKRE